MKIYLSLLILSCSLAFGDAKEFYFQRYLDLNEQADSQGKNLGLFPHSIKLWAEERPTIEEKTFDQKIAHDSCCDFRTFKQRYYIDSSLAKGKQAPVFLYICGEATCQPTSLNGAVRQHAKKFGAHLIALEHRYYGKSQPFAKLTVENLQYLSTEFAIKDLAAFQQYAMGTLGLTGRWISVGGSYAGSLSAYYREKLPELVVGALASSGPVRAEANFEEYDLHVAKVAGGPCATAVSEAVRQIESNLGNTEKMQEIKKLFAAEGIKDDTDFLYLVADIGAAAVQYGFHKDFCLAVQSPEPVKAYGEFAKRVYVLFGADALKQSMYDGAMSENPADYLDGFGMRQWMYQSCKEYGYWQNAYHDIKVSVRSARINADYHRTICKRVFGLDKPVDTDHVNKFLYEPLLASSSSKILFTNGSNDPWSRLSISKENGNDTNPGTVVYTVQDAAHCDDLRAPKTTDSKSILAARELFQNLVAEWLK